jgi:nickel-type superoxide dismutase maturation protease
MLAESLPDSGIYELLLWLLGLRRRVRVTGASMIPTLNEGDEVLYDPRAYTSRLPQIGDVVVAHRPDRQQVRLVKRVVAIDPDGCMQLHGDNPHASTDSYTFGPVGCEHLIGKVTSRFG